MSADDETLAKLWKLYRYALIQSKGYDGLIDFLSDAHATALIERHNAQTKQRQEGKAL